ncbi:MAG: hypothetical protein IJ193_01630 [Bacilli bacterium]|nr:hypothetical protein [Bacilli bacterium]
MKKNYEKTFLLKIYCVILFILLTSFSLVFSSFKISVFDPYQVVFLDDNQIQLFVTDKEYSKLLNNHFFYLCNRKYSYQIEKIEKNVFQKEEHYHSIQLSFSGKKKRKVNEIGTIWILRERKKLITIFQIIWKDDMDGKTNR